MNNHIKTIQFLKTSGIGGGVEESIIRYHNLLNDDRFTTYTIIPDDAFYKFQSKNINNFINFKIKNNFFIFIKVLFYIIKIKPNFFISHDGRGAIIAKIIKILFCIRTMKIIGVDHGTNSKKFIKYKKADIIFCVTNYAKDKVCKNLENKYSKIKLHYIPNFSTLGKLEFITKNNHDPLTIGTLCRLSKEKNVDILIKTISLLIKDKHNVKLIIAGDGSLKEDLMKLVKKEGIDSYVEFIGWIDNKEEFFNKIDIFCNPSDFETFGITTIESMKFSIPAIITDTIGANEIIKNGKGAIVVKKEDKDLLVKQIYISILKIKNDAQFKFNITKNAFNIFKNNFSDKAVKKKLIQILK